MVGGIKSAISGAGSTALYLLRDEIGKYTDGFIRYVSDIAKAGFLSSANPSIDAQGLDSVLKQTMQQTSPINQNLGSNIAIGSAALLGLYSVAKAYEFIKNRYSF